MNKYLTFPGLQPVYLGDIDFLQESVRSAFMMLLRGLTGQDNPRCIIAEATPEKDGVICFDGEILPLKYSSGAVIGALVYQIESVYSGERTFKNGETQKCYESRYVIAVSGSTLDPNKASGFSRLQDLLARGFKINQPKAWTNWSGENLLLQTYRSIVGSLYTFVGKFSIMDDCTVTSLTEDEIIVEIPTGEYYFPVTVNNNGVMKTIPGKMTVRVDSDRNYNMASITINQTSFKMDDTGYFSFNALNPNL